MSIGLSQSERELYFQSFHLLLCPRAQEKYSRFSDQAIRAIGKTNRSLFIPPSIRARMERMGISPERVLQNPFALISINTRGSAMNIPFLMAGFVTALEITEGYRVLEVGTGSGYSTAVLSNVVGRSGRVISCETDPYLADHARQALYDGGYQNVRVLNRNGLNGVAEEAPFDAIFIDMTLNQPRPPQKLLNQLRIGERMSHFYDSGALGNQSALSGWYITVKTGLNTSQTKSFIVGSPPNSPSFRGS